MSQHANFSIERQDDGEVPEGPLVIRDLGPWDKHQTITNDVEWVVRLLVIEGHLPCGRRLFYYDSEGELGEILITDGQFAGFAPAGEDQCLSTTS